MSALVFCGEQPQEDGSDAAGRRPVAFTACAARPRVLRPLDAVVRITCAGVCGSDLHCAWHCLEKGLADGTVVGHEAAGVVVALGDAASAAAASALRVGDRVFIPFTASCGACGPCARGDTCRCLSSRLFGWRSSADSSSSISDDDELHGCQAQYVRVPLAPSTLLRLPRQAPDELGVLLGDILSTAFFCARQGGVSERTRTVAVVGCGPVGLLAILAAKHESKGRARVVAIDGVAERRAMAVEAMGADAAVAPGDLGAARRALRGGDGGGEEEEEGADVVLELVGGNSGGPNGPLRLAFDLLRPAGVLASQGVHTGSEWPWTPVEAYNKNLTFKAGRCPARRVAGELLRQLFRGGEGEGEDEAARARRSGAADLVARALRVITHRLPMSAGVEAYAMFAARRDGCVKVVLDPSR